MAQERGYQYHLSKEYAALKDIKGRTQKFEKILRVLQDFHPGTQQLKCLDIGCSSGIITSLLGEHFLISVGTDIDRDAVQYAQTRSSSRAQFLIADGMALPFQDNSMDVIVVNHIYEHVPDASRMIDEVYRVLKKDGFCYFSAGNKYVIIEGHYRLPFLSWLPKPLAHLYLNLTGKGNSYYEQHLSLRGLRRLVGRFNIHDYTLPIIQTPEKFSATDAFHTQTFLYKCIRWAAPHLYSWVPTYVWILTKK